MGTDAGVAVGAGVGVGAGVAVGEAVASTAGASVGTMDWRERVHCTSPVAPRMTARIVALAASTTLFPSLEWCLLMTPISVRLILMSEASTGS